MIKTGFMKFGQSHRNEFSSLHAIWIIETIFELQKNEISYINFELLRFKFDSKFTSIQLTFLLASLKELKASGKAQLWLNLISQVNFHGYSNLFYFVWNLKPLQQLNRLNDSKTAKMLSKYFFCLHFLEYFTFYLDLATCASSIVTMTEHETFCLDIGFELMIIMVFSVACDCFANDDYLGDTFLMWKTLHRFGLGQPSLNNVMKMSLCRHNSRKSQKPESLRIE